MSKKIVAGAYEGDAWGEVYLKNVGSNVFMEDYAKAGEYSPILPTDHVNQAIGKLEAREAGSSPGGCGCPYMQQSIRFDKEDKTIFVSGTGSDETGDGSEANPYRSVKKVFAVIEDNLHWIGGINVKLKADTDTEFETGNLNYCNARFLNLLKVGTGKAIFRGSLSFLYIKAEIYLIGISFVGGTTDALLIFHITGPATVSGCSFSSDVNKVQAISVSQSIVNTNSNTFGNNISNAIYARLGSTVTVYADKGSCVGYVYLASASTIHVNGTKASGGVSGTSSEQGGGKIFFNTY